MVVNITIKSKNSPIILYKYVQWDDILRFHYFSLLFFRLFYFFLSLFLPCKVYISLNFKFKVIIT